MTKILNKSLFVPTRADFADTRIKYVNGEVVEILQCDNLIFNPLGIETVKKYSKKRKNVENLDDVAENLEGQNNVSGRAIRRAKKKLYDLCLCNDDLKYFVTLTLDKKEIDRYNYDIIVKKLNVWLDNAVRRKGLKYVLVPEQHKDGAYHFHGLINDNDLHFVDSGKIVQSAGEDKPIYNLVDWKYGFTTAIPISGDRDTVCKYIGKYITKQTENKIAGRYYYHGGDLKEPEYTYCNTYYEKLSGVGIELLYEFTPSGVNSTYRCYKIKKTE